jgi:single-strand DNA-binding protein
MASFNKVLLMGNLTRDPQLRYTPNQTPVVEFGIAVNRRWRSQDGQNREDVCFVDCTAFGRQGENINKYMSKGRPIFVEGRLKFDSWTAQDGGKRSKLSVVVENSQFLGGAGGGDGNSSGGSGGYGSSSGSNRGGDSGPGVSDDDFGDVGGGDDDIPF